MPKREQMTKAVRFKGKWAGMFCARNGRVNHVQENGRIKAFDSAEDALAAALTALRGVNNARRKTNERITRGQQTQGQQRLHDMAEHAGADHR